MNVTLRKLPYSAWLPNGWQAHIVFDEPQAQPNYGPGWGLGDFGQCVNYQGLVSPELRGQSKRFVGVLATYSAKPRFTREKEQAP